jgi:hypothetical protein
MDSKLTFSFFSSRVAFLQNLKNQIMTTNLVIMLSRHTLSRNFGGKAMGERKLLGNAKKLPSMLEVCAL